MIYVITHSFCTSTVRSYNPSRGTGRSCDDTEVDANAVDDASVVKVNESDLYSDVCRWSIHSFIFGCHIKRRCAVLGPSYERKITMYYE